MGPKRPRRPQVAGSETGFVSPDERFSCCYERYRNAVTHAGASLFSSVNSAPAVADAVLPELASAHHSKPDNRKVMIECIRKS